MRELAWLFFKLGCVAFGGPAVHIGLFEEETVGRRGWLKREHFLDLVGATNLIPGPNSTEMTMHIGYERAGKLGLAVAGTAFIAPAAAITALLAWFYTKYGTLPQVQPFLWAVKPAVLAIILSAVWRLGRSAVKNWRLAVLGLLALVAVLVGVDEVVVLLTGGALGVIARAIYRGRRNLWMFFPFSGLWASPSVVQGTTRVALPQLALFFLKVGATLYGSGYVLVAYLQGGLVEGNGWLTQEQLLDAIAMGQFTPGPVLTTATFVGYLLGDLPGAVVATTAIFLPSFLFVLVLNPLIPRMRGSPWLSAFLDAINVSAVGLMAAVLLLLGRETLIDPPAVFIALAAAVAVLRFEFSPVWIVLASAGLGGLFQLLGFIGS